LLCGHVDARLGGSGATDSGDAVNMDSLGNDWDKLITDMGDTPGNNVTDTLTKLVDPPSTAKALLAVAVDKPDESSMEADVWKVTGQDFLEDILPAKSLAAVPAVVGAPAVVMVIKNPAGDAEINKMLKNVAKYAKKSEKEKIVEKAAAVAAEKEGIVAADQAFKALTAPGEAFEALAAAPAVTALEGRDKDKQFSAPARVVPQLPKINWDSKGQGGADGAFPPPPPPAAKKQQLQVLDIGSPSRSSHASEIVVKVLGDKLDEANVKIAALQRQLALDKKTMDTAEAKKTESQLALDKKTLDTVNGAKAKIQSLQTQEHEEEAKLAQSDEEVKLAMKDSRGYKNQVDAIAKQLVDEHKTEVELRAKLSEGAKPFALEVTNLRAETVALHSQLKTANSLAVNKLRAETVALHLKLKKAKGMYQELNGRAHKMGHIAADIDQSRHAAKQVAWKSNAMLSKAEAMLTKVTAQNQKLKKQNKELKANAGPEKIAQKKLQALRTALEEHKAAKVALAKAEEAIKEAPHGEPVDAFTKVAAEAAAVRDRSAKVIASFVKETVG